MILSSLGHGSEHLYPEAVQQGLAYIKQTDFSKLQDGKYEIIGDQMYALVIEATTQPLAEKVPESHVIYTDIQFLLSGEEIIGFAEKSDAHVLAENELDTRDMLLYKEVVDESILLLNAGMYAVFFPWEVHRPCCSVNTNQKIRKVVVKIHRDLLTDTK
jgi:biofilm protein TabA